MRRILRVAGRIWEAEIPEDCLLLVFAILIWGGLAVAMVQAATP